MVALELTSETLLVSIGTNVRAISNNEFLSRSHNSHIKVMLVPYSICMCEHGNLVTFLGQINIVSLGLARSPTQTNCPSPFISTGVITRSCFWLIYWRPRHLDDEYGSFGEELPWAVGATIIEVNHL